MTSTTREVVVIGGGFSGLLATYLLEALLGDAVRVVLVEASGRLGGRIHTGTIGPQRLPYEAGAAEFYDVVGAPHLRQLIAHLGLTTRPLEATPTFFWRGERLDTEADFRRCFGDEGIARLDDFWRRGTQLRPPSRYAEPSFPRRHPWGRMTFAEVLATVRHDAVERFIRAQINSDLAAPPEQANGVLGFDNLLVDHPSYCRMFTVDGGNARLIERLAAASRASKLLGTALRAVRSAAGRFDLELSDGRQLACDGVFISLMPRALEGIAWHPAELSAAIRAHCRKPAVHSTFLRVTLAFNTRFWRASLPEDYFVSDAFGGSTVYDQSPRPPRSDGPGVLSWLLAGAGAERWMTREDGAIVREVLATAPEPLLGAADRLLEARVDRWPVGAARAPTPPANTPRPEPVHNPAALPGLVLAGDYMYDATIGGAMEGVLAGVAEMLDALAGPGPNAARRHLHPWSAAGPHRGTDRDDDRDDEARPLDLRLPFLRRPARG